jgi:predicted nucleotidyltransferase
LREIVKQLYADYPEVVDVRVFGSIARGDQVGTSDVDVLPVGVDVLVYTREQLSRRLQAGDAFVERIWQESLAL